MRSRPSGSPWRAEPGEGGRPAALGAAGDVDDLALPGALLRKSDALPERRVVDRGGEEGVPVLAPALDVAQPVTDVGQHAVDVEDGQRPASSSMRARYGWSSGAMDGVPHGP
jgi:hypothetical protein